MASSLVSTRGCTPISTSKAIPLLCSVCPDTPRFSDVSHLLTHIASKGHLHHETQTKLKAHQDIVSSVALQQYERWYKENGIESLLVERMKAKQKKEAVRSSRSRDSSASFVPNKASTPEIILPFSPFSSPSRGHGPILTCFVTSLSGDRDERIRRLPSNPSKTNFRRSSPSFLDSWPLTTN